MTSERRLAEHLVGEHQREYLTNAWFKSSIDLLARFLPVLVDGLATQAAAKDAEMQQQYRELTALPFLGISGDDHA